MNEEGLTQSLSSIVEKYDVPNCDAATFYTTNQFPYNNNCAPTAGVNLMMYWHDQRGISNLSIFAGSGLEVAQLIFPYIYNDMNTNYGGKEGTSPSDCYQGLLKYANSVNCPPLGDDYIFNGRNGSIVPYQTIRNNIVNGNPVLVDTYSPHTKYGDHSVDVFGIEQDTDAYYLRIADGWGEGSHQTWISYSELYPQGMMYLRWQ